ncbi:MAG: AAA family ATPase [bacterium]
MDFIGNTKVASILRNSLKKSSLGHAYLFSGPQNVGKFTLAKMFALAAISGDELSLTMDEYNKEALLDLLVVEPEMVEKNGITKQRDISIEAIRDAKNSLSLFPYHGKYKILIVDSAHKMNVSAQNGLLKILEEPNPTTIIILVTHEIDRILPTIISRLQILNFGLVEDRDMQKGFGEDFSFQNDCIELSIGRPGLAKFLNANVEEKNFRIDALMEFEKMKKGTLNEKFKLAEQLSKDTLRTIEKLNIWLWEIRKSMIVANGQDAKKSYDSISKIQKSMTILKRSNANGRLVLETLFMDI